MSYDEDHYMITISEGKKMYWDGIFLGSYVGFAFGVGTVLAYLNLPIAFAY